MATIRKVVKVRNPRRYRAARSHKRGRNAKGRFVKAGARKRNTSTRKRAKTYNRKKNPVIRRYTVKALKKELRRRGTKVNPSGRRKRHLRRTVRRKRNPVLIELGAGALNPKRRKNVAKSRKRRKSNPRRRHATAVRVHRRKRVHRRRRNPMPSFAKAYGYRRRTSNRRRRRNPVSRRRHHRRTSRRNPAIFGRSGGKDLLMMVGGGLVGVAATKYLPTLLPTSITSGLGGGPLMSVIITGAGAFAAGWLAKKFLGTEFGDAVLFGGLMQAGSAALNAFAPPSISGKLALSGVGDIVPGWYSVPQNPVTSRAPIPITSGNGMGNLRRFGTFR